MSDKPLFVCYSLNLMLFLKQHGISYEIEAMHKLTKKSLWVYIRDDKLKKLLKEWSYSRLN